MLTFAVREVSSVICAAKNVAGRRNSDYFYQIISWYHTLEIFAKDDHKKKPRSILAYSVFRLLWSFHKLTTWWMKLFSLFPSWMVLAVPRQLYRWPAVTCESLVSQEFLRILLTFHFSISRHFHFTFHSRSQSQAFSFHFSFSKWVKGKLNSLFNSRKE